MEGMSWWSRLGLWLRSWRRSAEGELDFAGNHALAEGSGGPVSESTGAEVVGEVYDAKPESKLRFTRSTPNLDRLAEEYARVVKLMNGIEHHMAVQDERSEQMVHSLDRLVQTMSTAMEASQKQLDLLSTISEAVSADAAGTKRIEESLSQFPQIADAQRETMVSLGRQLDSAQATSEQVSEVMGQVHQAVNSLGEVTTSSTQTLDRLQSDNAARDERLAMLLTEQTRRLSLLAWSAIGLAAVVAVTSVVGIFR